MINWRSLLLTTTMVVLLGGCGAMTSDSGYTAAATFINNVAARVAAGLPQVTILPNIPGPIPPSQGITVRNKLMYARVFAYGDRVGELGPDTELNCPIYYNPWNAPVPIVAALYRNRDFTDYVGIDAVSVLSWNNQVQQSVWTTGERVLSPEGQYVPTAIGFTHSAPVASGARAECKFRMETLPGTSGIQLVNNTNFRMRVRNVKTGQYALFEKGWPYYVRVRRDDLHPVPGQLNVHVDFVDDGGRLVGYFDYPLPIVTDGVTIQQVVIMPQMIRR